jgi:hypothetical protein
VSGRSSQNKKLLDHLGRKANTASAIKVLFSRFLGELNETPVAMTDQGAGSAIEGVVSNTSMFSAF